MTFRQLAPFFSAVWMASTPLLLWALHFWFCYFAVAVVCTSAMHGGAMDPAALRWVLVATTIAAIAMLAALLWRDLARSEAGSIVGVARQLTALIALVGIAWAGVPLALLPVCAS